MTLKTLKVFVVFLLMLTAGCGKTSQPNIILIIIDTLRADHLGCYGYYRDTSPAIDSLAETGITFLNVHGQSSWTLPAVTSIFTGLNVKEHGAGRRGNSVYAMNYDVPTIPLMLKREGYSTMGIFNVFLLSEQFGFNKGFDRFSCDWLGDGRAGLSVDEAIEWISEYDDSAPFFLSLHVFDPHDPYSPPSPYDEYFTPSGAQGITWWPALANGSLDSSEENLEHLTGLYDGEIAWTDSQLERLFAYLRNSNLEGNTIIIITADHGEEFLEHQGVGHGYTMHREIVHVPIIIAGPGIPADSLNSSLRSQTDILPTIMDIISADKPEHLNGHSLLSSNIPARALPASNVNSTTAAITAAVTMGNRKLIWNTQNNISFMYDIALDPFELEPLPPDSDLVDSVLYYWSTPPFIPAEIADQEAVEAVLQDLGYF
ncbi:MAG: sulfatase [Kiritimatiellae bacterium]|nr:sulfatase [Kiritimatiellia bacterium]